MLVVNVVDSSSVVDPSLRPPQCVRFAGNQLIIHRNHLRDPHHAFAILRILPHPRPGRKMKGKRRSSEAMLEKGREPQLGKSAIACQRDICIFECIVEYWFSSD